MSQISIKANNLRVEYDRHIALTIEELNISGKVIAVLGHNGAGKSTLLKTMLELLSPKTGELLALASNGDRLVPNRDMAFCPENGAVFEDISVEDYLKVWLRIKAKSPNLSKPSTSRLIDLFEIAPLLKKFGRELSKGQRRRVQSVVGFLIEPKLFLFDEPFDGLDIQKTAELSEIIESMKEEISFMISSHRMDVMERVCDSGLVLEEGKVIVAGKIEELSSGLAGQSLVFHLPDGYVVKNLNNFIKSSDCYLSHIGQNLIFTGHNCKEDTIKNTLELDNINVKTTAPSLTDAMAYHLKRKSYSSVE